MSGVKGQVGATIGGGGDRSDVFFNFISELDILIGDRGAVAIGDIGPNSKISVQHPCRECKTDVEIIGARHRSVLI